MCLLYLNKVEMISDSCYLLNFYLLFTISSKWLLLWIIWYSHFNCYYIRVILVNSSQLQIISTYVCVTISNKNVSQMFKLLKISSVSFGLTAWDSGMRIFSFICGLAKFDGEFSLFSQCFLIAPLLSHYSPDAEYYI